MADFKEVEKEFVHTLLTVNIEAAEKIITDIKADFSMTEIADNIIAPAFKNIGRDWEQGTVALSQVYMSVRLCEQLVDEIMETCPPAGKVRPRIAIVVIEDYHSLGKKVVSSVLKVEGFKVLDYGQGLSTTEVIERAVEDRIELLLISALTLPSASLLKKMTRILKLKRYDIKVVVGGAPFIFDKNLWKEVGADAMGVNAADAIGLVRRMGGKVDKT